MKRQISVGQYRAIDLTILTAVLAVSQFVISVAASVWFPDQLYVVSPVAAVAALVMMRWNGWAAIPAAAGGILYALLSGGTWQHLIIFGIGNLLSLLALVLFRVFGKERIRADVLLTLLLALCVQLLMVLGRAGVAAVLGFPAEACLGFITTDILSGLFTMLIIWAVRRIDGLFEDQIHYLLRLESERKAEGREQF